MGPGGSPKIGILKASAPSLGEKQGLAWSICLQDMKQKKQLKKSLTMVPRTWMQLGGFRAVLAGGAFIEVPFLQAGLRMALVHMMGSGVWAAGWELL